MKEEFRNLIALHTNPNIPLSLCNILKVSNDDVDLNYLAKLQTLSTLFNRDLETLDISNRDAKPHLLNFLAQIKDKLISITNGNKDAPLNMLFSLAIATVKAKILHIERLVFIFKKIYRALYNGETNHPSKECDFLEGKENYSNERLYRAISNNNTDRTKKALELTAKYYDCGSLINDNLFNETYDYAFEHSGSIKMSRLAGVSIFRAATLKNYLPVNTNYVNYAEENPDSRTAKIIKALR